MESWMFDLVLTAITTAVMAFVFFKLVFSSEEHVRRELAARPSLRLDRREAERVERRRRNLGAPGGVERRVSQRR